MVKLTIEIPEELAENLKPWSNKLPELLTEIIAKKRNSSPKYNQVYEEFIYFLGQQPSQEEIINFKVSPETQARIALLLEKNRENSLNLEKKAELAIYEQFENMVILLKAKIIK
jgi:predicted nucleotidyltransferase